MTEPVHYLTVADLYAIAEISVGQQYIVRDHGLLASAAARPQATVFGADAYPTLWGKAAALMQSLARNHPLVDGNKRIAFTAGMVFLDLNGIDITGLDEGLAYDLMISIASGETDEVPEIADQLTKVLGLHP
ncbi:type II toxin-antitoxin system death-on-curing family toxin [Nocardia cyriacigeorgica]|uniref:type II toxin-antitoxin system death-on-curing family toxin n=1 Tax=Nocardia cyriacigeorgica TaxID=135487 RepID=UPI0018930BC9|nr:type II toxin-antitoxin system death-on-curing family toxin [Nocardia cyriacigeorgica]MBF6438352.1 type II toxin-antitoxin system death-on-curing family toxin [Nocardia cyriacigeorgica]MBF6456249.1 type II toxin-antitoxin system death-on-curing family toxin [Nocardia cyriacigeorgica]MBF6477348.1 type II toxin-antitoxin system death-on-curing family toxin [Nocardia cyriacigeorgica]MBF6551055.1 type II toxin-antitoxin system death-on-curing family toxin [Nocardia cyriacigeorgica]